MEHALSTAIAYDQSSIRVDLSLCKTKVLQLKLIICSISATHKTVCGNWYKIVETATLKIVCIILAAALETYYGTVQKY